MQPTVRLYSVVPDEIKKFLKKFYGNAINNISDKKWQKEFPNPIEIVDIIGAYVENLDDFNMTMWISIDSGVFIKVTQDNADELIKYLYERFPY